MRASTTGASPAAVSAIHREGAKDAKSKPDFPVDASHRPGALYRLTIYIRTTPPSKPVNLSTPAFQILLSLVDEDQHGYAIIMDVAARTDGEVRLTASTLYTAIKRMLEAGWIDERATPPRGQKDDPRRRYYRLTRLGRETLKAEAARIERLASMARAKGLLSTPRTAAGQS